MSEIAVPDDRDCEMIDGKIIMMARPSLNHSTIAANIWKIFSTFLKGKTCKAYLEPDVFLDENNNFIPDVLIVCDRDKRKGNGIYGAPDLAVEVLSPSTAKKDLGEKKNIYEKYGVREYWTVDPDSKAISVFHLRNGSFALDNLYFYRTAEEQAKMTEDDRNALTAHFKTSLFDGLIIHLEEIFEDIESF
ncbi:MAG: Uma2 family endonuclease [Clostridiales bacterium]|nr:Uma2 family endonuclease [Clostridiales bacterium]